MTTRPQKITQLKENLICVLADNPSPMTYWGTNTFILGDGETRILIDPGPEDTAHLSAIDDALDGANISHILVTHAHLDHSGGAPAASKHFNAPVLAFGDATSGRSPLMQRLAQQGMTLGGEGMDANFSPDKCLAHQTTLSTAAGEITALHTPGHMANHLSFDWQNTIFCGDLIMAWSSSLISPPCGDAAAYVKSCRDLRAINSRCLYPAHGPAIENPMQRIDELLNHRATREAAILSAVGNGKCRLNDITQAVYTDIPPSHLPAAARNTFAHLIDLTSKNRIIATPKIHFDAQFELCAKK